MGEIRHLRVLGIDLLHMFLLSYVILVGLQNASTYHVNTRDPNVLAGPLAVFRVFVLARTG